MQSAESTRQVVMLQVQDLFTFKLMRTKFFLLPPLNMPFDACLPHEVFFVLASCTGSAATGALEHGPCEAAMHPCWPACCSLCSSSAFLPIVLKPRSDSLMQKAETRELPNFCSFHM